MHQNVAILVSSWFLRLIFSYLYYITELMPLVFKDVINCMTFNNTYKMVFL